MYFLSPQSRLPESIYRPSLGVRDTKFILPTADSRPIALNGGVSMPGWSNIFGLDLTSPEDREGFDATSRRIHTIVQAEIDRGLPPERVVVGGFSQGGAAALHFSLRCPHALGGVVAFSTWLPLRSDYPGALSPSDDFEGTGIGSTLQSSNVSTFAIIVVTTNVPLLMYLILDFIYFERNDGRLLRFAIVLTSFTSFLLLFCTQYLVIGTCLFICIYYWQIWIWASVSFMSLSYYDDTASTIFATWKMATITLFFSAARIFHCTLSIVSTPLLLYLKHSLIMLLPLA